MTVCPLLPSLLQPQVRHFWNRARRGDSKFIVVPLVDSLTGVSAATSTPDITEPDPPATIAGSPSEKATSAGKPRRDKKPKKSSVDSAHTPASSVASSSKLPVAPAPMSPPKKKRKKDKHVADAPQSPNKSSLLDIYLTKDKKGKRKVAEADAPHASHQNAAGSLIMPDDRCTGVAEAAPETSSGVKDSAKPSKKRKRSPADNMSMSTLPGHLSVDIVVFRG